MIQQSRLRNSLGEVYVPELVAFIIALLKYGIFEHIAATTYTKLNQT